MPISKKIRFEVFKRDGFTCAYCGNQPPQVTLEIDHIQPKSKKGKDSVDNYVTACFDCNRGKSNITLDKIPNQIAANLEILKEKEVQLKEYNKYAQRIENRLAKEGGQINEIYGDYFEGWGLSDHFINGSLRRFQRQLPLLEIKDAMDIACTRTGDRDDTIKYFCGICWKKIKGDTK